MQNHPFDKPHRLKGFNYSAQGSYMVTFNVKNRKEILSEIYTPSGRPEDAKTRLTDIGRTVENAILGIPLHYKNVYVEKYAVMPDHVHLILTFTDEQVAASVETSRLSRIVHALKRSVTNALGYSIWQLDFYDQIPFSNKALDAFLGYVDENPMMWLLKKEEPEIRGF